MGFSQAGPRTVAANPGAACIPNKDLLIMNFVVRCLAREEEGGNASNDLIKNEIAATAYGCSGNPLTKLLISVKVCPVGSNAVDGVQQCRGIGG